MAKIVQEKFQTAPLPHKDDSHGNEWVSDESARRPGIALVPNTFTLVELPPGSEIERQRHIDARQMPHVAAGTTDVSQDWNPHAARHGYTPRKLRPTDDNYTNEHVDMFYSDMTVDGVTGFLERGNTLDRQ